jgi:uncharacterized membrane protein YbhN (UPF0104 family)
LGGDVEAGRLAALIERLDRLRVGAATPRRRNLVLAASGVALVVGAIIALQHRPDVPTDPRPWLLALSVLVAAPLQVALNGAELLVMARIGRHRMPTAEAARVTVLSSAANLLPIPGAALVRARALQRLGATGRHAVSVTVVVALGWIAASSAVAGALLLATDPGPPGLVFFAVGAGGLGATWALLGRFPARRGPAFLALAGVEVATILVAGLRLCLAINGMGYSVGLAEGAALALAAPLASIVGLVPGGVGLREAIAAALAPLVGVTAAVALLGTIVDRVLGALVQVILGVVLLVAPGLRGREDAPGAGEGAS